MSSIQFHSVMVDTVTFGFLYALFQLFLGPVGAVRSDRETAKSLPFKLGNYSFLRICIHILVVFMLGASSYGFYWLMQKDHRRKEQMQSFMKDAHAQLGRSSGAYFSVQHKYNKLQSELFDLHNRECCFKYASMEEADALVVSTEEYSVSWQRELPYVPKQRLKAALVRRAIAILPRYEEVEKEFKAKAVLFDKRLIADSHFQAVKDEYETVCNELELIIREANCLEEGWGSRTDGLFLTARTIQYHEAMKEKANKEKRKAELEKEKEAQRLEGLKKAAEKEERERLARQEKKAAEALESLLEEEKGVVGDTNRKKDSGKDRTRR